MHLSAFIFMRLQIFYDSFTAITRVQIPSGTPSKSTTYRHLRQNREARKAGTPRGPGTQPPAISPDSFASVPGAHRQRPFPVYARQPSGIRPRVRVNAIHRQPICRRVAKRVKRCARNAHVIEHAVRAGAATGPKPVHQSDSRARVGRFFSSCARKAREQRGTSRPGGAHAEAYGGVAQVPSALVADPQQIPPQIMRIRSRHGLVCGPSPLPRSSLTDALTAKTRRKATKNAP